MTIRDVIEFNKKVPYEFKHRYVRPVFANEVGADRHRICLDGDMICNYRINNVIQHSKDKSCCESLETPDRVVMKKRVYPEGYKLTEYDCSEINYLLELGVDLDTIVYIDHA